jgi:hypothetical protein
VWTDFSRRRKCALREIGIIEQSIKRHIIPFNTLDVCPCLRIALKHLTDDCRLLGCDPVLTGKKIPKFITNIPLAPRPTKHITNYRRKCFLYTMVYISQNAWGHIQKLCNFRLRHLREPHYSHTL